MSKASTRYPIDQYLVESSKKFEMVNILDDNLWNIDPALKPEDELILRKLHEMLQTTADDLKVLSGELSKFHQPGVQVKSSPTPLDEEFNKKVHIEEIVNAKFHGYKLIDKAQSLLPVFKPRNDITSEAEAIDKTQKPIINNTYKNYIHTASKLRKPIKKNLGITRTNVIQIDGNRDSIKTEKLNNGKVVNVPTVAYNEYSHEYVEPKLNAPRKVLEVQEIPCINIRSELKEQKAFQLDILPEMKISEKYNTTTKNVAVVVLQHEIPRPAPTTSSNTIKSFKPVQHYLPISKPAVRKISKMTSCGSSGSTENISTDTQSKLKQKQRLTSPKNSTRNDRKKINTKKETRSRLNLEEWRRKLNDVYTYPKQKNIKQSKIKSKAASSKITNKCQNTISKQSIPNNVEYIPYSKLTLGGAKISDIEKELSGIPKQPNMPLTPILDKILSSRENSFTNSSPRKTKTGSLKILTTSDENLLQEVIEIEKTIGETISKNVKNSENQPKPEPTTSDAEEAKEESYVDDFEDDKSNHSGQSANQTTNRYFNETNKEEESSSDIDVYSVDQQQVRRSELSSPKTDIHNMTFTKISNLSFKNKIDVFEYIHAVDTQDSATQSNGKQITPKESQTSPRNDRNVQPIHNDLWPSIDPNGRVEKMFELEKEFIKKLILDEYGDILEKNIIKASTSKEIATTNNEVSLQKNTQTSPAHVKHVMTSPTRTKTRTTSPFTVLTADHHTSPLIFVSNEDKVKADIDEDLAISINLSSPRFSLRLPRNSQEVLSNLGDDSLDRTEKKNATLTRKNTTDSKTVRNKNSNLNITTTSSSSVEADSSDISSLGEIRLMRMFSKMKFNSDCESVCSNSSIYSSDFQSSILPLKSEGELSLTLNKKSNRHKSEGEGNTGVL